MTDLEIMCVNALRLSQASATALLSEIQTKISIARADMVRSGISETLASSSSDMLVCNVIVKYVVSEMASLDIERSRAYEAYRLCLDELRKA